MQESRSRMLITVSAQAWRVPQVECLSSFVCLSDALDPTLLCEDGAQQPLLSPHLLSSPQA